MVIYIFQCYSLKSSHPHLLPYSPKGYSLYLGLFCCLAYRIVFQFGSICHLDPDNHDGVITHLETDNPECEVKWALGSITMNKLSGGDGIPVEQFQILKDDVVKVLHSIHQQIWKTQQWPQDQKTVFIPIPRKGNPKECSNYHTTALISHASKVMLTILHARLQKYVNRELSVVQAGFRKGR